MFLLLLLLLRGPNGRPIRSLADLPGFERLPELCRRYGVHFTLRGSLLRQLLKKASQVSPSSAKDRYIGYIYESDLFDFVPFMSEIQLVHTGPDSLTSELLQELLDIVPHSECFRWQLQSAASHESEREEGNGKWITPVNAMELSTSSQEGIYDPFGGVEDHLSQNFRFIYVGSNDDSPVSRDGHALEAISAVMQYYQILLDSCADLNRRDLVNGVRSAYAILVERSGLVKDQWQASARFVDLFVSLCAAATLREGAVLLWESVFHAISYTCAGPSFAHRITDIFNASQSNLAIVSSACLQDQRFRLEPTIRFGIADAKESFERAASRCTQSPSRLAPEQDILLASNQMVVSRGVPLSSRADRESVHDNLGDEFIYIAAPISDVLWSHISHFEEADLAAMIHLHVDDSNDESDSVWLAVPSVFTFSSRTESEDRPAKLCIRMNCGGALNAFSKKSPNARTYLQVFVVGCLSEEKTAESNEAR